MLCFKRNKLYASKIFKNAPEMHLWTSKLSFLVMSNRKIAAYNVEQIQDMLTSFYNFNCILA